MAVTLLASDIHGDVELAEAIGKATHSLDAEVIFAGDMVDDRQILQAQMQIAKLLESKPEEEWTDEERQKIEQMIHQLQSKVPEFFQANYKKLDEILGKYRRKPHGVTGNHDARQIAVQTLKNLQFLEGKKTAINGLTYYGMRNYSVAMYEPDTQEAGLTRHPSKEELSLLGKEIDSIDFLVMHEGAHEKLAHEGKGFSPELAEMAKKANVGIICGHIHNQPVCELKGQKLIRIPGTDTGKGGMVFAKVVYSDKFVLYGIEFEKFKKAYLN